MKQYVAFLRGINVNGIKISMAELKINFEKLGYSNVTTYLNTGNIKFETNDPIELVKIKAEKQLSLFFSYIAYVLFYNYNDLKNIVDNYPFKRLDNYHAYVILIDDDTILEELSDIITKYLGPQEQAKSADNVIYWQCPKGQTLDTQFAKILSKSKYKTSTTTRNINTLEKILK